MNAEIVVGVGGGIAAYKACELVRRLREAGHDVWVIPTVASLQFVGAATWEALSGNPVRTSVFEDVHAVAHVQTGKRADLIIVAPATANVLAKAVTGQATDLLSATLLMTTRPVLFAPAMHTEMWQSPATATNVATLRERGHLVVTPASGRLTGSDSGPGRLPEPAALADLAAAILTRGQRHQDLLGKRVVISAGGTREAIDPVRFIGNRSSGKQGWALAAAAITRGAEVSVVAANVDMPDPAGADVIRVTSAQEMHDAMRHEAATADIVVMAAAVADFRPGVVSETKIKKTADQPAALNLEKTVDVLAELGTHRASSTQIVIGFAAETAADEAELVRLASEKRERKSADYIVANRVGRDSGFEVDTNSITVVGPSGVLNSVAETSKFAVAHAIYDVASS